ncbi:hypothetical protein, partial [Fournierella sp.]|uniref:hypothetical protein n=1 Tax=Allofournierella sp. TaxID=1940256 RepID=UPI003079669E
MQFQVVKHAGKFWRDVPPEAFAVNGAVLTKVLADKFLRCISKKGEEKHERHFQVPGHYSRV